MSEPAYVAIIQRVADGETRQCPQELPWADGSWGWWAHGNYSCDCNRFLEFERANGHEPDIDAEIPCGETRYRVLRFEFPDGTVIAWPDEHQ